MAGAFVRPGSSQQFFSAKQIHREKKLWGEEQWIVNTEYCGKKLILKKNRRCSLHLHKTKDEVFYLQSGLVKLELGNKTYTMHPGDFVHIKPKQEHRFTGLKDSEILEFSTHHKEADSFRKEYSGHADPERYARQSKLLQQFSKQKILVIGDVMLDKYTHGRVDRVSPEAPIPVVRIEKRTAVLGGAGNSAAGIKHLGGVVTLISVIGNDDAGCTVTALLKKQGIAAKLLRDSRPTTVKERIIGSQAQQIVRVDSESTDQISAALEKKLVAAIKKGAKGASAILLSDYAKGVLTPGVMQAAYELGKRRKIPVIVDPKPHGIQSVALLRGASAITPNVREARQMLGDLRLSEEKIGTALSRISKAAVILTRGERGIDVCLRGKKIAHFDALSPDVVDVSGAGDTVAAAVTLTMAADGELTDAADIGNRAASVVVSKHGTATVNPEELDAAL
jgi:rfaE bifunctional protein kinase chain/domain